jgi:hypothetical protein
MFPASSLNRSSRRVRSRRPAAALPYAMVLLVSALVGCSGDYCIIGIFNPTGIVTGTTAACVNKVAMGNVSVRVTSPAISADGPIAPNFLHVFVTLQGIEAHTSPVAPEDSPGWEELAPDLTREPMQIDLMAQSANSCATNRIPGAQVSAGAYRQIRLRLAPGRAAAGEVAQAQNACGEIGAHCAISPDGRIHPLTFSEATSFVHIAPDRISGGFFTVLPDADIHLMIEFNQFASFAAPSGDAVRLTPIFSAETAASCGAVTISGH